jgi:hypothetical protein
MSEVNTQQLPPGIPTAQQQSNQQPAPAAPAQPAPTSPMLSYMSQPAPLTPPAPAHTAPAAPTVAPVVPEAPALSVDNSDAFGALGDDPQVKLVGDYLNNVAKDLKLDLKRAVGQSVNEFDSRFIDTAYIRETVKDPAKAEQIIKSITGVVDYAQQSKERLIQDVYGQAGGEANWKAAIQAFNKTAPVETRDIIKGLLESGKANNVKYAVQQILQSAKSAGVVVQHVAPTLTMNGAEKGYSRAEYAAIIAKNNLTDAEYSEARRLRALGKSQGLE